MTAWNWQLNLFSPCFFNTKNSKEPILIVWKAAYHFLLQLANQYLIFDLGSSNAISLQYQMKMSQSAVSTQTGQ